MTEQLITPQNQELLPPTPIGAETLALTESLHNPLVMDKIESSWDDELEDAGMQHVVKLDARADQLLQELIALDGDAFAQRDKNNQIVRIRDTQQKTFGSQYNRFKDIQAMKRMYENSDRKTIPVYGEGAREMAAHFLVDAEQCQPSEQIFIDSDLLRVRDSVVTTNMEPGDEPFDVPVSAIVSAEGFESWEGRGVQSSADKIADYASRETPIPPVTELYGFVLPNGKMIYMTANSHRVGAALQKGDTTVPFKGFLTISKLDHFPKGTSPDEEKSETTTANGREIKHPREIMDSNEFSGMVAEYGLDGKSPAERADQLKKMTPQKIASLLADTNRRAQGSEETLIHKEAVKIAGSPAIAVEERYDAFMDMSEQISSAGDDISPERLGDTLALGTVLLHPFADGNGRTARLIASIFRPAYDNPSEYTDDFNTLVTSRDKLRADKVFAPNGYIPQGMKGQDYSNPDNIKKFLSKLLTSDDEDLYTGPWGQASVTNKNLIQ